MAVVLFRLGRFVYSRRRAVLAALLADACVVPPVEPLAVALPGAKLRVAEVTVGGVCKKSGLYLRRASLRSVVGTLEFWRTAP